ncbi:FAD-dependent monooxygenase (plasmid) [Streptomyces cynarae]|uniref:FAD-dependent monooxygenase n=1 Tax=Streptomyces cynarae TaxID=2981134 RepID=A0ABY6EDT5_9ACTN|nr:FAD-dependent monooxygenase [Streptomyces cynarae]UXY24919.1 FAD-dependent monooxygenase [Streptomyces cynarae]
MRKLRAIIIGGSLTGMLSAAALARYAEVHVIERDVLPPGAEPRKGLPQARHGHLLWSGGVRAIESILPGFADILVEAGGRRVPIFADLVSLAPQGVWFTRRQRSQHYMLLSTRDLLDATMRAEVLALHAVTLHQRTEFLSLVGDASRVTGARIRKDDIESTIEADLVIDASGRGSRAQTWLQELGLPQVSERTVDSGVGYATRLFRAPSWGKAMPIVNVQADPRGGTGTSGVILPVEGNRWLVTVSGTRGVHPSGDPDEFETYARSLRHPVIGELITGARPESKVFTTKSTANRRRYYEKADRWPEGFVVLGDAVATYNPVYGQGMSVAAKSVAAMLDEIQRHGLGSPGIARRIQRAAARHVETAWSLAVTQDNFYDGASEQPPTVVERLLGAYVDRIVVASTRSAAVSRALLDVMSMEQPPIRLLRPTLMLAAALSPSRSDRIGAPPLRSAELNAAGYPSASAFRHRRNAA